MVSDTQNLSSNAESLLTNAFSTVHSLNTTQHNTTQHNTTQHNTTQHNTTQHNTTQHIEETLSTIHLSGTRPARNFSYQKVPAGLFLFKSFFRGYFPVCVTA